MPITIAQETPLQEDVRQFVAALNAYLRPLSPPQFQFQMTVEQMAEPHTTLLVARDRGISSLKLETGNVDGFAPAWRLYERGGFTRCGAFLDYPDSGYSAFFEKTLTSERPNA